MNNKKQQLIGSYQVLETLNETPEWNLLKCTDPATNTDLLIKIYFPNIKWTAEQLNEFFDRVGYLKFIEHPNLLEIKDFGKYKNTPYVVYPYLPYLFNKGNEKFQIDEDRIINQFYRIAEVLDYLHRQEIFHSLLNLENILVDENDEPKLFDYGISDVLKKVLLTAAVENLSFLSISNIRFTAPELIWGGNPTRQSDIYSYGLLYYYGLFHKLPGENRSEVEAAIQVIEPELRLISPKITKDTSYLLTKCLANDLKNRFDNFQTILKIWEKVGKSSKKNKLVTYKYFQSDEKKPFDASQPQSQERDAIPEELITQGAKQKMNMLYSRHVWVIALIIISIFAAVSSFLFFPKTQNAVPENTDLPKTSAPVFTPAKPSAVVRPTTTSAPQTTEMPTQAPTQITIIDSSGSVQALPALENETGFASNEKLSVNNIKDIKEISRLGFGKPEDIDISITGEFAVATSTGVYIYKDNKYIKWIDPGDWSNSVQFSPSGDVLAIGLLGGDIQLWDWKNETKTGTLSGHTKKVTRLIYSINGRHLYSASDDQNIIVWDANLYKQIQDPIHAHAGPIHNFTISTDERTLVSCADTFIYVWDLSTRKKGWVIPFEGIVSAIAISSDGEYVAVGGENGKLRQWNIRTKQPRTDVVPVRQRIWNIKYVNSDKDLFLSLDNMRTVIYSASQEKYPGISLDFKIAVVDVALKRDLGSDFLGESYAVPLDSGKSSVAISWDGQVNGNGLSTTPTFDNLDQVVFSQDGTVIAAYGKRGITSVWMVNTNQVIFKDKVGLPPGQPISPDSQSIAIIVPVTITSPQYGNLPVVIDAYQFRNVVPNSAFSRQLSQVVKGGSVSYARDGELFISSSLNQSKLWDFKSGLDAKYSEEKSYKGCWAIKSANTSELVQINSNTGLLDYQLVESAKEQILNICKLSTFQIGNVLAASQSANVMAYIKPNGRLESVDIISGKPIWDNFNHQNIASMAISPDGSIIALGDSAGNLFLIDSKTGNDLIQITGNYGAVQAITFTNQGNILATAGSDGAVRLFGINPGK